MSNPKRRVCCNSLTVHRLALVSVVLAAKYIEDKHWNQGYSAEVVRAQKTHFTKDRYIELFRVVSQNLS